MPEAPKAKAPARSGKKSEYKDKDKPSQIRQSNITAAKCKCHLPHSKIKFALLIYTRIHVL